MPREERIAGRRSIPARRLPGQHPVRGILTGRVDPEEADEDESHPGRMAESALADADGPDDPPELLGALPRAASTTTLRVTVLPKRSLASTTIRWLPADLGDPERVAANEVSPFTDMSLVQRSPAGNAPRSRQDTGWSPDTEILTGMIGCETVTRWRAGSTTVNRGAMAGRTRSLFLTAKCWIVVLPA